MKGHEEGAEAQVRARQLQAAAKVDPEDRLDQPDRMLPEDSIEEKLKERVRVMLRRGVSG